MKGPEWRRATSYFSVVVMIALTAYLRVCPRPQSLPLETAIDGPNPATANRVVIWLHGRGGSIARTAELVKRLRDAGLPTDVSIVVLEGPFPTLYGHAWGDGAREQAISRARVRARLAELLGARGHTPSRVIIAGFSQGAGLAGDVAAEEPRVQALASFSPCGFWLRAELPKRASLRVLLAHGKRDAVCPVEESRSLAAALTSAHLPVQYLEFDGEHTVPSAAVRALVTFASAL